MKLDKLQWLLSDASSTGATASSRFTAVETMAIFEVGPRLNVCTPFSTNAVAICGSIGLPEVTRIEPSRRFAVGGVAAVLAPLLADAVHDRMTECRWV